MTSELLLSVDGTEYRGLAPLQTTLRAFLIERGLEHPPELLCDADGATVVPEFVLAHRVAGQALTTDHRARELVPALTCDEVLVSASH